LPPTPAADALYDAEIAYVDQSVGEPLAPARRDKVVTADHGEMLAITGKPLRLRSMPGPPGALTAGRSGVPAGRRRPSARTADLGQRC
jgi:arylsulfatase A-like enzyme